MKVTDDRLLSRRISGSLRADLTASEFSGWLRVSAGWLPALSCQLSGVAEMIEPVGADEPDMSSMLYLNIEMSENEQGKIAPLFLQSEQGIERVRQRES